MTSFCKNIIDESLIYKPGYFPVSKQQKSGLTMRLRIEREGYESRQLASLIGKMTDTPNMDSKIDYIMMRTPQMNELINGTADVFADDLSPAKSQMFNHLLTKSQS